AGGAMAQCVVTVLAPPLIVQRITLPDSVTYKTEEEFRLRAQVFPITARAHILWEVEDKSIVTMLADGKFRAIKPGKTTIIARAQDAGGVTAQCVVTVLAPNVARIELPATLTQQLNSEFNLTAQVSPKEATSAIVWEVQDNTIISSLGGGKFRAIKPGKTTIIARAQDAGGVTAQCVVTVLAPNVARIELPATLTQQLNSEFNLTAQVSPKEATSAIVWEVQDKNIVAMLADGKFRAIKPGTTTITARAQDAGGAIAKCVVTIIPPTAIVSHTNILSVRRNDTMLLIEQAPAGLPIIVYDLTGRILANGRTSNDTVTRLHVGTSPLWFVVIGNKSYTLGQ
ncbi:Ig domain-containing protein, partial [Alloprevotella sp. oral taxon 473]|uniref:Ig-like domain-containing protein n=1 Tax=Alloprevotella sp. oral taxon 473 TaxID=712469 RepID=UPI0002A45F47